MITQLMFMFERTSLVHLRLTKISLNHRRRKVLNIAGGRARFRTLGGKGGQTFRCCKLIGAPAPGGQGSEYWGERGAKLFDAVN